jgi:hypothetical protein
MSHILEASENLCWARCFCALCLRAAESSDVIVLLSLWSFWCLRFLLLLILLFCLQGGDDEEEESEKQDRKSSPSST